MTRYQIAVLLAAWMGWGFDALDGLLFNYVAPNCVPTLLGLTLGSPEAQAATLVWTGRLTSVLLVGWAFGGIIFGQVADRIGRSRTLVLTILLYSVGTALCATADNIWVLLAFRILSSLGIGGEWAAGASMVAEVMPDRLRVQCGALLYTAAPVGIWLAARINLAVAGSADPRVSWRYVFLCGLIPAAAALAVRLFLKEPEGWKSDASAGRIAELFQNPEIRPRTFSGLSMVLVVLLTWWTITAFLPMISGGLARDFASAHGLDAQATQHLVEGWKTRAMDGFSFGGLLGTLLTAPIAIRLGRRPMFGLYFLISSAVVMTTFGVEFSAQARLNMFFLMGVTVFGAFGSFTYYLPELFPTRLRATGSGLCYNLGRIVTALGPLLVGEVALRSGHQGAMNTLFWVGVIPLVGIGLLPLVVETRGKSLDS